MKAEGWEWRWGLWWGDMRKMNWIVCQAPRRQRHSADLLKDLHCTCARQSRLQDCRPLLQIRQTATTFLSLLVYSRHIDSRPFWGHLPSTSDLLSTQSSSTNIAARRFSCCVPTVYKKAVLSQRWPRDERYISRSWAVAEIWPFKIIQDGGGRHLEFVRIENSAIRSAVSENPTLEQNMKCIG